MPERDAELPKTPKAPAASSDDPFARELRGFGPIGILAILVVLGATTVLPIAGPILVLMWAQRSGTPWREIGYVAPESWLRTVIVGIVFGCAFKLLMKAIVMPLLGADPINHAYHYLVGNPAVIPQTLFLLIVSAGFGEETLYRGFLFERLGKLLGSSAAAKIAIVVFTSTLFALAHLTDQGVAGAEQAVFTGLAFGAIVMVTGRIWLVMIAHAAFDLTAYAIIYWNLETAVSHAVFK
jgi:membrane protease YdiL (CAAX protease family)